MVALERLSATVRSIYRETRRENVSLLASSIAYSAFVSLLPLLALLLVVTAAVGQETLAEQVVDLTRGLLAPAAQGMLADALANASARAGASLVGVVTLLWGTLKLFRGLDTAFSAIYETERKSTFLDQLTDSVVVLTAFAFAVVMAVVAGGAFVVFEEHPLVGFVNPILLVVGLSITFFPIYYVFPDRHLSAGEVLPGVTLAAVGWAVLEALFQVYVSFSAREEIYGLLGGVLLLLTWLYLSSFLLLLGGVVNAVLAGRTGEPEPDEPNGDRPDGETDETERDVRSTAADGVVSREEYERLRERYDRLRRDYAELEAERPAPTRANTRIRGERPEDGDG